MRQGDFRHKRHVLAMVNCLLPEDQRVTAKGSTLGDLQDAIDKANDRHAAHMAAGKANLRDHSSGFQGA